MRLSKIARHARRILVVTAMALAPSTGVRADLALTPAGQSLGFSLSTFATGFPSSAGVGPLGIAFTSDGVLVSDQPGNVRLFPSDTDGQNAATVPVTQFYGPSNALSMAQVGGATYMIERFNGALVQLNADGTLNQTIVTGLAVPEGMAVNPSNGHLYVATGAGVFDVDPIAKTKTLFVDNRGLDGLTVSPDGGTLYGAWNDFTNSRVVGYNTATKALTFDTGNFSGPPDGTAVGVGPLAGNIFANTNGGTVVEINLTTKAQTVIASGGSRGDFVTIDPNGSLLLTQTDRVVRLTPPAGGFATVPEPSPLLLCGLTAGGLGVASWLLRKRNRAAVA